MNVTDLEFLVGILLKLTNVFRSSYSVLKDVFEQNLD